MPAPQVVADGVLQRQQHTPTGAGRLERLRLAVERGDVRAEGARAQRSSSLPVSSPPGPASHRCPARSAADNGDRPTSGWPGAATSTR